MTPKNFLLKYFKNVRKSLKKEGVFFLDIFGGTEGFQPLVEETEHSDFFAKCRRVE